MSDLGTQLRKIRELKGLSLRDVEKRTGVSNGYLSQLERGDAKNPSPSKLAALAKLYGVSYEKLLAAAGYLKRPRKRTERKATPGPLEEALITANLTPGEELMVADFITNVLRSGRKSR